jgi:Ulp1 protease family, C-terminal catalytic domain
MPSHGLLTPPVRATNDAPGLTPSTKRRRSKSVGTPESNDLPEKRQRTEYGPASPGSTTNLFQEREMNSGFISPITEPPIQPLLKQQPQGSFEPWELVYPLSGKRRASIKEPDLLRFNEGEWLNDKGIFFCFRYLEYHLDVSNRIYFFDPYFYENLNKNLKAGQTINYEAVQRYTKRDDLFRYDYVAIPIWDQDHWYLAIICNLPLLRNKPNSDSSKAQEDLLRPWKR